MFCELHDPEINNSGLGTFFKESIKKKKKKKKNIDLNFTFSTPHFFQISGNNVFSFQKILNHFHNTEA